MHPPLAGKNVLVTREASQAKFISKLILEKGGQVHEVPLLKIACRNDQKNIDILNHLEQFEWIFFTSVNGVHCFFTLLEQNKIVIPKVRFAVVGHKTEEALQEYGYQAELVPAIYDGENMISEFFQKYSDIGQVLLVQGSRSRDVIERGLIEKGIDYQSIVVYETQYNDDIAAELKEVLSTKQLDFITFTSPSTVEAFKRLYTDVIPSNITIVCIGNTTEKRAIELGFVDTISPEVYTVESMVELMCNEIKERQ